MSLPGYVAGVTSMDARADARAGRKPFPEANPAKFARLCDLWQQRSIPLSKAPTSTTGSLLKIHDGEEDEFRVLLRPLWVVADEAAALQICSAGTAIRHKDPTIVKASRRDDVCIYCNEYRGMLVRSTPITARVQRRHGMRACKAIDMMAGGDKGGHVRRTIGCWRYLATDVRTFLQEIAEQKFQLSAVDESLLRNYAHRLGMLEKHRSAAKRQNLSFLTDKLRALYDMTFMVILFDFKAAVPVGHGPVETNEVPRRERQSSRKDSFFRFAASRRFSFSSIPSRCA